MKTSDGKVVTWKMVWWVLVLLPFIALGALAGLVWTGLCVGWELVHSVVLKAFHPEPPDVVAEAQQALRNVSEKVRGAYGSGKL